MTTQSKSLGKITKVQLCQTPCESYPSHSPKADKDDRQRSSLGLPSLDSCYGSVHKHKSQVKFSLWDLAAG